MIERFVSQFDACSYGPGSGFDCTCAVEAMWLFRASQGKIVTTACAVRRETHDTAGGTNLRQMQTVSVAHGITTGHLYEPTDIDAIFALVQTGRYASQLNISYAPVVGTGLDAFHGGFRGNHDIFLSGPGATPGTIRVGDPGAKGFRDWGGSLLKTAAGRLEFSNGVTLNSEYGGGKCYAYVTPADPRTTETLYAWRVIVKSPRTPVYAAPGGAVLTTLATGSGTGRLRVVNGLHWLQIVTNTGFPTSAIVGKWLHLGPTIKTNPI